MSVPGRIRKLDETLVNRIAAGEVVQRPVNALKELLENSLDANSTDIVIRVQYGSMKFMQIQDNGTGIRKEDLPIVCQRFTTSKLMQFEDLKSISTFGFRGEALASISHVAHVTIVTKTADALCAYSAQYRDGRLINPPMPTAGNQGTQITVEDIFYNIPNRRQALKNFSEEYHRIFDMVSSYAIHNPSVGFAIKKQGDPIAVLRTLGGVSHSENIKEIYGYKVSRELLEISHADEGLQFKLSGFITNVNYSTKKQVFLLFINNRLVDSAGLRKSLDSVYSLYLPKGSHPFMYLSLTLDPRIVDVNVHPTKHEVHFLHEDNIIEKIRRVVDSTLSWANSSRIFHTQVRPLDLGVTQKPSTSSSENPSHTVRTDASAQKIDKFFYPSNSERPSVSHSGGSNQNSRQLSSFTTRDLRLTSVLNLREEIERDCNLALREIFANLVFVGVVDQSRAIFQSREELYLCNTEKLLSELFYQIMVYSFGGIGELILLNKPSLFDIIRIALLEIDALTKPEEQRRFARESVDLLMSKSLMLKDYFSLQIDGNGCILTIPYLLKDYVPDMSGLPLYFYSLVTAVNWDDEEECFRSFCRETAKFYCKVGSESKELADWGWVTEHVAYHTAREVLRPPSHMKDDCLVQMISVPRLYKVFERC